MVSYFSPFIWLFIIVLLGLGARVILRSAFREWQKTAFLIGYTWIIWFVLTSV